jgi:DNA-binding MarR family transcriptional regulator
MIHLVMDMSQAKRASKKDLLTLSQLTVLVAIRDHERTHKITPTCTEVAERLGVGKQAAHQSIAILLRKGVLRRSPGRFRTLVITRNGYVEANKPRLAPACK